MKKKVAYVCVHNSCRSQIAEALTRHLASDVFEAYSAGTELKNRINVDAVRIVKERYDIDMEILQKPKLLDQIPEIDILITMGCNVECPYIPCSYRDDWGLMDPSGQSDEVFLQVMDTIEKKILELREKYK